VIDLETRQERRSRKEDVALMARISDALPLISFFWPLVSAQDHGLTAPLHECHAGLTNTLKHVRGGTTVYPELAAYLVEMAELGGMMHCVTQQQPLGKVVK
jgi:trimethylamine:corrinoid methyltransferase-like protein